jgi:hypothetical protein
MPHEQNSISSNNLDTPLRPNFIEILQFKYMKGPDDTTSAIYTVRVRNDCKEKSSDTRQCVILITLEHQQYTL